MHGLLRAEWLKTRKSVGFWTLIVISAGLTALILAMRALLGEDFSDGGVRITGVSGLYTAFAQAQLNLIFVSVWTASFICAEINNRTFGTALFSGCSRLKLMAAKMLTLFAGVVIITTVMPVIMLAVCSAISGIGTAPGGFVTVLRDYALYSVGNMAMAAVCALIAFALKNVGGTIGLCIGLNFGLVFVYLLNIGKIESVIKFVYIAQLQQIGDYKDGVGFFLAVTLVTLAAAFAAAGFVFGRAELK